MLRIFPLLSLVLFFFLIFLCVEILTYNSGHFNQSKLEDTESDLSEIIADKTNTSSEIKKRENLNNKLNDIDDEKGNEIQKVNEIKEKLDKKDLAEFKINFNSESDLNSEISNKGKQTDLSKKKNKKDKEILLNEYRIQFGAFAKEKNALEFKRRIEIKLRNKFEFLKLNVSYDNKKKFFRILSFVENQDIADEICEFSKNEKIGCLATKR